MTERKPSGMDHVSWADRQIADAMARGEFDNIPGQGKPIEDLDTPYDEVWFRRKLRDEGFDDALLPESLALRKQLQRLPETVATMRSEGEVRRTVEELNDRITRYLSRPSGPPVTIGLLDEERVVAEWREGAREAAGETAQPSAQRSTGSDVDERSGSSRRPPWWRRLFRATT